MAIGRKTGGRQVGTPNKRTAQRDQAVQQAAVTAGDLIPEAFAGDAHALLMFVYKDPSVALSLRIDAARAAIRHEKPTLSSVDMNASIRRSPSSFADAELAALAGSDGGEDGAGAEEGRPN